MGMQYRTTIHFSIEQLVEKPISPAKLIKKPV